MLADANRKQDTTARQRLSGAERREAIIHAAVELFAQRGFRGTTTREIAAAVGVTEPVLYQHFETKRELYTAIIDAIVERGEQDYMERLKELEQTDDERAFFTEIGRHILHFFETHQNYIRLLYYATLEGHELCDLWYDRAYSRFFVLVEQFIERRITAGTLRVINPALAARSLTGVFAQYGQTLTLHPCAALKLSVDEVIDGYVSIFLDGIRRQDAIPVKVS